MSANNTPGMKEERELMYLTDEDGNEMPFELLDIIDYQDDQFAVFFPADEVDNDDEGDDEVVILKVTPYDDGTADMESIDDEEKLDAVFDIFMKHVREEFETEYGEYDEDEGHNCDCGCCHE